MRDETNIEQNSSRWLDLHDFNGEVWGSIKGFPHYRVSNFGRVKSISRIARNAQGFYSTPTRIIRQYKQHKGYMMVNFNDCGVHKAAQVHRLVADAFIKNESNLPEVNHKDEDKTNNRVENLEWCTHIQNSNYGTRNERIRKTLAREKYCCTPIKQYTQSGKLVKVWDGINIAMRETGIKSIPFCVRQIAKLGGGYVWLKASMTFEEWSKLPVANKRATRNPVNQYTLDGELVCTYSSASEAGRKVGTSGSNIIQCCKGNYKTIKGYLWKFKM